MDLSKAYQEYGGAIVGKSVTGEAAKVAGVPYNDVIGVHSKSIIKIDTHRNSISFKTKVGISDTNIDYSSKDMIVLPLVDGTKVWYNTARDSKVFAGLEGKSGKVEKGSVVFIIMGDDKELFNSGKVSYGEAPLSVEVSLQGIRTLELIVDAGDDGLSGDHALWIEPEIEFREIVPVVIDIDFVGDLPEIDSATKKNLDNKIAQLPEMELPLGKTDYDWLINSVKSKANVYRSKDNKDIIISNDMVFRVFRVLPNLATVDVVNRMTGEGMLRAVSPEGFIRIDGKTYTIGGLAGQPERGYLKEDWIDEMTTVPNSFLVEDFEITNLENNIQWASNRWALNKEMPTGKLLTFTLRGENELKDVLIKLHFSIYP